MKKAAIELSMNFLVVIILAIVIFGAGIYLMNKLFGAAGAKVLVWDRQMQDQIESLMDDGSQIAIPFDSKTIPRGKLDTFGIGIFNTEATGVFEITIVFDEAFTSSGTSICKGTDAPLLLNDCGDPHSWIVGQTVAAGTTFTKTIKQYDKDKFLVGIDVPKNAPTGSYLFSVSVKRDLAHYPDSTSYKKILIVNVP